MERGGGVLTPELKLRKCTVSSAAMFAISSLGRRRAKLRNVVHVAAQRPMLFFHRLMLFLHGSWFQPGKRRTGLPDASIAGRRQADADPGRGKGGRPSRRAIFPPARDPPPARASSR